MEKFIIIFSFNIFFIDMKVSAKCWHIFKILLYTWLKEQWSDFAILL